MNTRAHHEPTRPTSKTPVSKTAPSVAPAPEASVHNPHWQSLSIQGVGPKSRIAPDPSPSQDSQPAQAPCNDCASNTASALALGTQGKPGIHASDFGGGVPLNKALAAPFEASYQANLANVRIHPASSLPGRFGWDALTLGDEVAFAPGRFRPNTRDGLALIGHELAHVVQQRRGGMRVQAASDHQAGPNEREAWTAAKAALTGKPAMLSSAPLRAAGGSAGGCFMPGVLSNVIGSMAHQHIQAYYNMVGIYSEVSIPAAGRADLVWATQPPAVPVGQTGLIRPPGYLTSPPHPAPAACAIGEIKPISEMATGGGVAQNASYILGMNTYYGQNNTGPLLGTLPVALVSGDPTFIPWPPQMLHMVPGPFGVYYYFCRPMGELLPIMEYLREMLEEWMRQLRELLERAPDLRPILEPVLQFAYELARAIGDALEAAASWAWDHFWEILAVIAVIVAVVLVVIFFAEIMAVIAGIAAAIMAAVEAVLAGMSAALATFASLLTLFGFASAAAAQEPEPPRRPPAEPPRNPLPEPPIDPGCFPHDVSVLRADGRAVPIDAVAAGDVVIAWDEARDVLRPCPVDEVHRHPPEALLELSLSNGRILVVTHLHTLRLPTHWALARDLGVGDHLVVAEADGLTEAEILAIHDSARWEPVYNLSVGDCPTYIAEGVVVHNIGMAKPRRMPMPTLPETPQRP